MLATQLQLAKGVLFQFHSVMVRDCFIHRLLFNRDTVITQKISTNSHSCKIARQCVAGLACQVSSSPNHFTCSTAISHSHSPMACCDNIQLTHLPISLSHLPLVLHSLFLASASAALLLLSWSVDLHLALLKLRQHAKANLDPNNQKITYEVALWCFPWTQRESSHGSAL